jgi:hypothetical protein
MPLAVTGLPVVGLEEAALRRPRHRHAVAAVQLCCCHCPCPCPDHRYLHYLEQHLVHSGMQTPFEQTSAAAAAVCEAWLEMDAFPSPRQLPLEFLLVPMLVLVLVLVLMLTLMLMLMLVLVLMLMLMLMPSKVSADVAALAYVRH